SGCRGGGCGGGSPNSHHRSAHFEVSFRLPEDMIDMSPFDLFTGSLSTASLEEIGSKDDLFSTYIDVEKLSGGGGASNGSVHTRNESDQNGYIGAGASGNNEEDKNPGGSGSGGTRGARPRHRHSDAGASVAASSGAGRVQETEPFASSPFHLSSTGSEFLLVGVGPQPSLVAKSFS
ncbi:hypothetical protein PIB30_101985, partial [Stylosanthes scabra]|nr:hypothetical protein [Stylosanthes scabra]